MTVDLQMPTAIGSDELDLEMVKLKIQDHDEGLGWTVEQCERVEVDYRRYLGLSWAFPDRTDLVPYTLVDAFWHQHILDTQAYAEDCTRLLRPVPASLPVLRNAWAGGCCCSGRYLRPDS